METPVKKTPKIGEGKAGPGRGKGTPNKTTALIKDAIIKAAEAAGGNGGMVGYLTLQAHENPGPFMALLGKVLPTQVAGDPDAPIVVAITRQIVDPKAN
ncbi:MAG: hypothetical protein ACOH2M_28235 [Cypionkella sp.]